MADNEKTVPLQSIKIDENTFVVVRDKPEIDPSKYDISLEMTAGNATGAAAVYCYIEIKVGCGNRQSN
jgi:hypothetical protein